MCSAHVNQRSSKNCIIPLGVGAARGDYSRLGFLTQTITVGLTTPHHVMNRLSVVEKFDFHLEVRGGWISALKH